MKKINVYVGENIQDLDFQCGGGAEGFKDGVVIYGVNGTHRNLIETGLHSRKVAEKVIKEIEFCKDKYDLNISTHSDIILNVIGIMISKGKLSTEGVSVYGLSEDNMEVVFKSSYEQEGYLVNWPYGFLDWDSTIIK